MARCRIGFVGAGGVAARHARMLTSVPDAELLVVTDLDADRARRFGEQVGARPVPDLGALLDAAPDAVYVCVPPFTHGLIEETVAAAGAALRDRCLSSPNSTPAPFDLRSGTLLSSSPTGGRGARTGIADLVQELKWLLGT